MTNKEKYAKELLDILCKTAEQPALVKGKIVACNNAKCCECEFKKGSRGCDGRFKAWTEEEYKAPEVDWTKVPVDTKILVRGYKDISWCKAHFASYEDGKTFAFPGGRSSWTTTSSVRPIAWNYAEIADPEEREKYLKYE